MDKENAIPIVILYTNDTSLLLLTLFRSFPLFLLIAVNCGDQINSTEGSLAALDDDADGMYDNIQYCIWDFDRGTKELIHINIIELSVQRQNQSCLLDRLEVGSSIKV